MATPSKTTIKRLFALSGNRCAFLGCAEKMIDDSGTLIGRVCHICGDRPDSKRYDPAQQETERQGFANLILLCPKHHIIIDDDEVRFTVSVLKDMKKRHEEEATEPYVISDRTAEHIILVMGGAIAGAALAEAAKDLGHVIGTVANVAASPEQSKRAMEAHEIALRQAGEILRYAPKGSFTYFANKRVPLAVGMFFAGLFTTSGWRELDQDTLHEPIRSPVLDDFSFCMVFFVADRHQVSNAKQAIDEVFRKFGFEVAIDGDVSEFFGPEHRFRAYLIMAAGR